MGVLPTTSQDAPYTQCRLGPKRYFGISIGTAVNSRSRPLNQTCYTSFNHLTPNLKPEPPQPKPTLNPRQMNRNKHDKNQPENRPTQPRKQNASHKLLPKGEYHGVLPLRAASRLPNRPDSTPILKPPETNHKQRLCSFGLLFASSCLLTPNKP